MTDQNQTTDKPPHPLVIDNKTGLCRYATQDDIHRMEAICVAYKSMVEDARHRVERADIFMEGLS